MRTVTHTYYTFEELTSEAQSNAIRHERTARERDSYCPWMDETIASLKSLIAACYGVQLRDWSIGPERYRSYLKLAFEYEETRELRGARAFAWFENNLYQGLRKSWYNRWPREKRQKWFGYGYRPEAIPDCPFTGYCHDDTLLACIQSELRKGANVGEVFEALLNATCDAIDAELVYYYSDEAIREDLIANEYEFTAEGVQV